MAKKSKYESRPKLITVHRVTQADAEAAVERCAIVNNMGKLHSVSQFDEKGKVRVSFIYDGGEIIMSHDI